MNIVYRLLALWGVIMFGLDVFVTHNSTMMVMWAVNIWACLILARLEDKE